MKPFSEILLETVDSPDIVVEDKDAARKVASDYMNDPLYKAVLTAKNEKEFKKALDTLTKVRGMTAVHLFQKALRNAK